MSKSNSKPILITMGEPAGIGPEVAITAFEALGGRIGGFIMLRYWRISAAIRRRDPRL